MLSDLLTTCLQNDDLYVGILALQLIFKLLTEHGLDYPKYYERLYSLLAPASSGHSIYELPRQQLKQFLRLLDLSLRSTKLASRVIAAFIKRLVGLWIVQGRLHDSQDKIYMLGFIANLVRRHPRCLRLLQRKKVSTFQVDPFKVYEKDPANARALTSSLWEMSIIMQQETDDLVK